MTRVYSVCLVKIHILVNRKNSDTFCHLTVGDRLKFAECLAWRPMFIMLAHRMLRPTWITKEDFITKLKHVRVKLSVCTS